MNRLALAKWLVDRRQPTHRPGRRQSLLGPAFRHGDRRDRGRFRHPGRSSQPSRAARLAGRPVHGAGWDTKAMIKLIVTSATYRQSSRVTSELLARDPRNRLLARAPRVRLEAEMVRDQALALERALEPQDRRSQRLSTPARGPLAGGLQRPADMGDQPRERTSIAAPCTRSGGARCPIHRWPHLTPPAARSAQSSGYGPTRRSRLLSRSNDPVYVEAAQALARRIVREGGLESRGPRPLSPFSFASAGRRRPIRSSD